jgi:hypothetical protein
MAEKELTYVIKVRDDGTAVISKLQSSLKTVTDQKSNVDALSNSFKNLGGNVASNSVKKFGKDVEASTLTAKKHVDSLASSFTFLGSANLKNTAKGIEDLTGKSKQWGEELNKAFTGVSTGKITKDIQDTAKVTKTSVDDISKSFQTIGVGPSAATTKRFTDDLQAGTKQAKVNVDQVKTSFDTVGTAAIAAGGKVKAGFTEPIEGVKKAATEATSSFNSMIQSATIAGGISGKMATGFGDISKELKGMKFIEFGKGGSFSEVAAGAGAAAVAVKSFGSGIGGIIGTIGKWTFGIGTVTAALAAMRAMTLGAIKEAAEQERIIERLKGTLGTYGYTWNVVGKEIIDWSNNVRKTTTFNDEEALITLNAMMFATNSYREGIKLSDTAMKLSKRTGVDLESTYRTLQLAITGNVEALGRQIPSLRGAGVLFSEYATIAEKATWAQEAFNKIVKDAPDKIDIYSEAVKKLQNSWDELMKSWGQKLLPSAETVVSNLKKITDAINKSESEVSEMKLRAVWAKTSEAEKIFAKGLAGQKEIEPAFQAWKKTPPGQALIQPGKTSEEIKLAASSEGERQKQIAEATQKGRDIQDTITLQAQAKLNAKLTQLSAIGIDESQKVITDIQAKYMEQRISLQKMESGKIVATDAGAAQVLTALTKAESSETIKAQFMVIGAIQETAAKILESEGFIREAFQKRRDSINSLYVFDEVKRSEAIDLLDVEIRAYYRNQQAVESSNISQLLGMKGWAVEAAKVEAQQKRMTDEYIKATPAVKKTIDALSEYKVKMAEISETEVTIGLEKSLYGAIGAQRVLIDLERQLNNLKAIGTKDEALKITTYGRLAQLSKQDLDIAQRRIEFDQDTAKWGIVSNIYAERGLTITAERMRYGSEEATQRLKITEAEEKQGKIKEQIGILLLSQAEYLNKEKIAALRIEDENLGKVVSKEKDILNLTVIQNKERMKNAELQKEVSFWTDYVARGQLGGLIAYEASNKQLEKELEGLKEIGVQESVISRYRGMRQRELKVQTGAATLSEAAVAGLEKFRASVGTIQSDIANFEDTTLKNFASGWGDLVVQWVDGTKSMGEAFRDFAKDFLLQTLRMIQQMMMMRAIKAILGGVLGGAGGGGGMGGPGTTAGSEYNMGVAHSGGTIGESAFAMRMVPASTFYSAQKYHGGLSNDEFPAILQRGEKVTPKGQPTSNNTLSISIPINVSNPKFASSLRSELEDSVTKIVDKKIKEYS